MTTSDETGRKVAVIVGKGSFKAEMLKTAIDLCASAPVGADVELVRERIAEMEIFGNRHDRRSQRAKRRQPTRR